MSAVDDQSSMKMSKSAKLDVRSEDEIGIDVDEGFDSRPSSSMECLRLSSASSFSSSSSSSEEDEVFWGENKTSAKAEEAAERARQFPLAGGKMVGRQWRWMRGKMVGGRGRGVGGGDGRERRVDR